MTTTNKTVTVSSETLGYIECLRKLNELWECVSDTIEVHYTEHQLDEIMSNEYYPLNKAICDWLYSHMIWSMDFKIYKGDELTTI